MSAADAIGILGFALHTVHKLYDAVQDIKSAPEDIKALQVQIARVRGLLIQIVETPTLSDEHGRNHKSPDLLKLYPDLIEQARRLTENANCFIEKVTKLKDDGTRKINKVIWPFKSSDARELAEEFKALYLAMSAIHSLDASATIRSMEPDILAMEHRTITAMEERITRAVEHEITPTMERLLDEERIARILVRSLTVVAHQQQEGRHQLFDELSALCSTPGAVKGHSGRFLSFARGDKACSAPMDSKPWSSATNVDLNTSTIKDDVSCPPYSSSHEPFTALYPGFGPPRRSCPTDCRCSCHRQSNRYRLIPSALRSWLGDIHVPNSLLISLISSAHPCDDAKCVQTRESLSAIRWWLPTWFAEAEFKIRFQSIPVQFVIQTPRVVQSLNLFDISLEKLKVRLSTRELTVNDIEPDGLSVLHRMAYMVAFQHDQAHEMMRYLIEAGAPQEWEYEGRTVTEYVTDMNSYWFGSGISTTSSLPYSFEYNVARPLLQEDMDDAWESLKTKRNWNELHYLLANPPNSPMQLERELALVLGQSGAISCLNAKDRFGRTPFRQAIRSCPEAVDALFRVGANPHFLIASLVLAVRAQSWSAISPLIRAGADINERDRWSDGQISTALHEVIRYRSPAGPASRLRSAQELVRHGSHILDWDSKDERGWSALDYAAWFATDKHPDDEDAASLYELYRTRRLPLGTGPIDKCRLAHNDADASLTSTSLIKAGRAGNVGAIGVLIRLGAAVNERDTAGRTLLHLVAMGTVPNGYVVALELVRHGGYGIHWNALTADGETAEELAQETLHCLEEAGKGCGSEGYDQAVRVLELLRCHSLPAGMDYVYLCMHIDYCVECSMRPCSGYCSNGLRMPGGLY